MLRSTFLYLSDQPEVFRFVSSARMRARECEPSAA